MTASSSNKSGYDALADHLVATRVADRPALFEADGRPPRPWLQGDRLPPHEPAAAAPFKGDDDDDPSTTKKPGTCGSIPKPATRSCQYQITRP